ncbi:Cytochrome P450 monooxygenase [Pseudocercospora fuligena]|uniref:Cytochrome P450 monooxygenase n=1 Tax=Pseudocercospora fuligena TaxID=685502 RepID=A0A8H6RUM2_9PEZI|nr:Cytochrome P450 monooxygenase [Pseudocercospora fuligena]
MSKNHLWSRQRRFAKQIMEMSQKECFYSYPELEAIRLLFELLRDPAAYNTSMESFVARVTSRLAWGTSVGADELKQRARELLLSVSPTGALGNKLPAVMSLPESLSPAKAWELRRGRTEREFFETMQDEVRQSLNATGQPRKSWTRMFLENKLSWGFANELEGAYAVGMHGIAGALTIAAPMQSFCLALCHFPQHQAMLHEEIDRVLGDRLPTTADMPNMPVLRAFIRETLRWRPPVPTGIPHALTHDDIYEGYHIPKGSVIHPLEWSISRDPEVFPEPDTWNPLRWLDSKFPTYQEPLTQFPTITQYSQFGYGRRICQGMGVAEADLFVGLGSVAWLFSVSKEQHDAGPDAEAGSSRNDCSSAHALQECATPPKFANLANDSAISLHDMEVLTKQANSMTGLSTSSNAGQHQGPRAPRSESFSSSSDAMSVLDFGSEVEDLELEPVGTPSHYAALWSKAVLKCRLTSTESKRITVTTVLDTCDLPALNAETCQEADVPSQKSSSTTMLASLWTFATKFNPVSRSRRQTTVPASPDVDNDPTFNFSTLLIAKPLPFKFDLRVRNQARAEQVTRAFLEQKAKGEFQEERVFWKNNNQGDAEVGWGKVFM